MAPPQQPPASGRATDRRRRSTHSMESVLAATTELLDESGEGALTFRALAARLGTGVGSIYWYVSSREELLDRVTDDVMAQVLTASDPSTDGADPLANVRAISLVLFDELVRRPWLGSYLMTNTGLQTNSLRFFDRVGRQLMRLDLTAEQMFHATSTLISYVVGTAVDLGQDPPKEFVESGLEPTEFLATYADRWRALDAEAFPFLHEIADVFQRHDDAEVFRSGLDLLLAGLRQQAEGRAPDAS